MGAAGSRPSSLPLISQEGHDCCIPPGRHVPWGARALVLMARVSLTDGIGE